MITRAFRRSRSYSGIFADRLPFHVVDVLVALVLAAVLILIIVYPLRVNNDASLFLETGSLILKGKIPYIDFTDINFPLVMYLNAIPVATAQLLGLSPILMFSLLVFFLLVGSCLLLRSLLNQHFEGNTPFALRLLPLTVALYTFYLFVAGQYGQREQLFILLFLPGFVLRWRRWERDQIDGRLALLIGLASGLGAALKPQFLLIAFAPEAYWLAEAIWKHRKSVFSTLRRALLTPEVMGFVLFGVVYALALLLSPTIMHAFFDHIVPYLSSNYYNYNIGLTPLQILTRLDTLLIWLALAATLPVLIKNRPLARPLLVLTLAALVVFAMQGKGWYYHRIPVIFGVCALVAMAMDERTHHARLDVLLKVMLVPLLYCIVMLGGISQLTDPYAALRHTILKYTRPGDSVMIADSYVSAGLPLLVQTGRVSAGADLSGEPIGPNPTQDPDLAAYIQSMAQTITMSTPPLVLINAQSTCAGCAPGYGMLSYLQQIGFLKRLAPDYIDIGRVDQFEVYVRK